MTWRFFFWSEPFLNEEKTSLQPSATFLVKCFGRENIYLCSEKTNSYLAPLASSLYLLLRLLRFFCLFSCQTRSTVLNQPKRDIAAVSLRQWCHHWFFVLSSCFSYWFSWIGMLISGFVFTEDCFFFFNLNWCSTNLKVMEGNIYGVSLFNFIILLTMAF